MKNIKFQLCFLVLSKTTLTIHIQKIIQEKKTSVNRKIIILSHN
jgi:hypothetical protein